MKELEQIDAKKVYTNWAIRVVLPQVMQIMQKPVSSEQHMIQTKQVMLLGIDYAMHLDKNPVPIILAAALYQCGYEKGIDDKGICGALSLPIAQKFLERKFQNKNRNKNSLSNQQMSQILHAILHHESNKTISPDENYVAACLWDADRTIKVWDGDYHQQFSTKRGQEVASFGKKRQMMYLSQQLSFLNEYRGICSLANKKNKVATHGSCVNVCKRTHEKE